MKTIATFQLMLCDDDRYVLRHQEIGNQSRPTTSITDALDQVLVMMPADVLDGTAEGHTSRPCSTCKHYQFGVVVNACRFCGPAHDNWEVNS